MRAFVATAWRELISSWPGRIFLGLVILFSLETGYIAAVSSYPMVFDEAYHFGLIQYYLQHPDPFITHQPAGWDSLGNVIYNPSWLFHWLLAVPLRILGLSHSLRIEIVGLRFLNIIMVVIGLFLIRRISRQLHLPDWIGTIAVGLFAFTPVVVQLSAQINYDNLVILFTLLSSSLLVSFVQQFREKTLRLTTLLWLLVVVSLGSLVKYSFLPIAAVYGITAAILLIAAWRKGGYDWYRPPTATTPHRRVYIGLLITISIVAASIAVFYHGRDLLTFHSVAPDCGQVLSVTQCRQWGVWDKNYLLEKAKEANPAIHGLALPAYTESWVITMTTQPFGTVAPGGSYTPPSLLLVRVIEGVGIICLVAAVVSLRLIFARYQVFFVFLLAIGLYVGALFYRNFTENLAFGMPVAVQGRYLIPLLGLMYLMLSMAVYLSTVAARSPLRKVGRLLGIFTVTLLIVVGGGTVYLASVLPHNHWVYDTTTSQVRHPEVSPSAAVTTLITYS